MMEISTIIDIVIAVLFLVAVLNGWCQGLIMKVASLMVVIISYVFAGVLSKIISPYIAKFLSKQISPDVWIVKNSLKTVSEAFSYSVVFAIMFFLIGLVLRRLIKILKIVDYIPVIGFVNRLGGAVVGFLVTFIMIYIIVSILFTILPQAELNSIGLTQKAIDNTVLLSVFVP